MVRFIALCGYPESGKSEVQKIIDRRYGVVPIDDSAPLREAAMHLYGLERWHVYTQEGKRTEIQVGGEKKPVRNILGDLGLYLEKEDPFHLPRLAVRTCLSEGGDKIFSFGSVRMEQPAFFKSQGNALVIEVTREGCVARNAFDTYNRDYVDFSIENTFDPDDPAGSLATLESAVAEMLDPILGCPAQEDRPEQKV